MCWWWFLFFLPCYLRLQGREKLVYNNRLNDRFKITRMRGSAIRCVRSQCKSQWERPIFAPHTSETPQPISMSCQIYYYVPPGSWCAKFGWNRFGRYGSAHAWKNTVCVDFFLLTYLSVCLSVSSSCRATGHSFGAIFMLNGSNDVISQPLVPFGGHINIAHY